MSDFNRVMHCLYVGSLLVLLGGCASVDRFGTKMSVATRTIDAPGDLVYEGVLASAQKVGSMLALQFNSGLSYDVTNMASFEPGDIVRIYQSKEDKETYEARLWLSAESAAKQSPPKNRV